jgi:phosphatidylglycerophosphate synthase
VFLASGNHGFIGESVGMCVLGASLFHDAVDGHLARQTQQTSPEGETLDALGDKIVVFALIALLVCTLDVEPTIFYSIL